jgi:molybdenum cofactor synthesis domain-containing protein
VNAAVLTVSDGVFHHKRDDESGDVLCADAEAAGYRVVARAVVADDVEAIRAQVVEWCEAPLLDVALVLVTGGTGFAPRDVTPEALAEIYDRRAPGLDEAMRAASMRVKPHGMLTRGISGTRGQSLVLSFPGSPRACRENLAVVVPVLDHALRLLREDPTQHL